MIERHCIAVLKRTVTTLCLLLLMACDAELESVVTDNPSENTPTNDLRSDGKAAFAGLSDTAEGYTHAREGIVLNFPEDHGPHPDFRIEWWYLTANLVDEHGDPLGLQWTLFRQTPHADTPTDALSSTNPWSADQLWMAHIALSQDDAHRVAERFARGTRAPARDSERQAGVTAQPFRAWLDDWRLESQTTSAAEDALNRLRLTAHARDAKGTFGYQLSLNAQGPLVYHGIHGFSQKSVDGQGSMYYSQPFYDVEGAVDVDGTSIRVRGYAWLDREWSSQLLSSDQKGWDWFSLRIDNGARLMAFRLRGGGTDDGDYISGSWITPEGDVTPLASTELAIEPLAESRVHERQIPVRWRLTLPEQDLDLLVTARNVNRWMTTSIPYWEGAVQVTDTSNGTTRGEGYLEMTGY